MAPQSNSSGERPDPARSIDEPVSDSDQTDAERERRAFELADQASTVFSPSAPIDQRSLFAGRLAQFTDVINAVNQKGQHVILFGERGVGKTSLASVISGMYRAGRAAVMPTTINCDPTMAFAS